MVVCILHRFSRELHIEPNNDFLLIPTSTSPTPPTLPMFLYYRVLEQSLFWGNKHWEILGDMIAIYCDTVHA